MNTERLPLRDEEREDLREDFTTCPDFLRTILASTKESHRADADCDPNWQEPSVRGETYVLSETLGDATPRDRSGIPGVYSRGRAGADCGASGAFDGNTCC